MQTFLLMLLPSLEVLLLLWLGGRLLISRRWVLGWLRGTVGLLVMAVAMAAALLTWDLRGFVQPSPEQPLAVVSFSNWGQQRWRAEVSIAGEASTSEIRGDLWSMGVQNISTTVGEYDFNLVRPVVFSSRYLALEQHRKEGHGLEISLHESHLDSWPVLEWINTLELISAKSIHLPFLPMTHRSTYEVYLRNGKLEARAVKKTASR